MAGGPSEGRFSLVEHPIVPRGLAAPVHVHHREDEFSFVLEGRWGFQLGSDVVYAEPGDLVYKPRDVWHPSDPLKWTPASLVPAWARSSDQAARFDGPAPHPRESSAPAVMECPSSFGIATTGPRPAPLGIPLARAVHHGTDHRSRICTALTTLGVEPPYIDVWDFGEQDGRVVEVPPAP